MYCWSSSQVRCSKSAINGSNSDSESLTWEDDCWVTFLAFFLPRIKERWQSNHQTKVNQKYKVNVCVFWIVYCLQNIIPQNKWKIWLKFVADYSSCTLKIFYKIIIPAALCHYKNLTWSSENYFPKEYQNLCQKISVQKFT